MFNPIQRTGEQLISANNLQSGPIHYVIYSGIDALDLTADQVYDADELRFTRDPFDGLICAAARSVDLPLLTRDGDIRDSGAVRVVW